MKLGTGLHALPSFTSSFVSFEEKRMRILTYCVIFGFLSISTIEALPPPWVQKLIESKSGFRFESTTEEPPVVVYTATVIRPHPKQESITELQETPPGPTPYPWWKWKDASGKSKSKTGKGKYPSWHPKQESDPEQPLAPGPTQYPWWKWRDAYGGPGKSKSKIGKGKYTTWHPKQKQPDPEEAQVSPPPQPTQYPWWKWKNAYGGPGNSKSKKGKAKYSSHNKASFKTQ